MLHMVMVKDEWTYVESQLLIIERNGYPEETYYTFCYTPIPGDDGGTAGMICANTDDTDRIISQRQLKILSELASGLVDSGSYAETIQRTIHTLAGNPHDFPFVSFYPPAQLPDAFRVALGSRELVVVEGLQERMDPLPSGAWKCRRTRRLSCRCSRLERRTPMGSW